MEPRDPASPAAPGTIDILRYGLPGAALALLGIPLFLLVPPFFIEDLGLPAAAVGLAFLAARLVDLAADPLLGHWCRTAGRARIALAIGAPVLLAGITLLFRPPAEGAGVAWLFGGALLAYLGWTLVAVPLLALGAVLPADDAARARLAFGREAFTLAGTLAAIALPVAFGVQDDPRASLALAWWALLVLVPLSVPSLWPLATQARWGGARPWRELFARSRVLFAFAPYRRTLLAYFLNALANAVPASLLVLYVLHVLGSPAQLGLFLGLYLAAGLVAMPAWSWLARRRGAAAWLASMVWAAGVFAFVPWIGAGDTVAFALVCIATGFSVGADNALPAALQARVVADLRRASGEDDAALAFGWWSVTTKLALASGAALGLVAIDLGGFRPGQVDAGATTALVLAYAVLPVVFKLAAVAAAWTGEGGRDAREATP